MRLYDGQYKALLKAVRKRDKHCQMPNCKGRKCQVHHILTWAKFPHLRYEPSNCVLLCKRHHKQIFGKEEEWAGYFGEIVRRYSKVDDEFFVELQKKLCSE